MPKLATVLAILASLALPATASAHGPRLTVHRAADAIARAEGPGTTIGICHRLSASALRCRYATPASNVGIETEDPAARWESEATARLVRGRVIVRSGIG